MLRLVVLGLFLLAPVVALGLSPWRADSSLWYFGMLPAVMGLLAGPKAGYSAAGSTPLLMGAALALRHDPAAGGIFMAAIGVLVGFAALRGWNVMGAFSAPLVAMALIGAPSVVVPWEDSQSSVAASSSLAAGLVFVAVIAIGGLWTTVIGEHIAPIVHLKPPATVPVHAAAYFAVALGVLVGPAAYVAMRWIDSPDAWWVILTLFVVVQPYYLAARRRVVARVAGTLAGSVVAIGIVEFLHSYPFVITIVALLFTVAAPWANLKQPYWVFVLFLTPAVVLETAGGPHAIVTSAGERALYTVVGSVVAIIVLTIGHALIGKLSHRSAETSGGRVGE